MRIRINGRPLGYHARTFLHTHKEPALQKLELSIAQGLCTAGLITTTLWAIENQLGAPTAKTVLSITVSAVMTFIVFRRIVRDVRFRNAQK